jgi:hypothetical protein
MSSSHGSILKRSLAIGLFLFYIFQPKTEGQKGILDSVFTFRAGNVRTAAALELISKQTGFGFTYDSRLIDIERKTKLSFKNAKLSEILDSIVNIDSVSFSVIDRYIIISRKANQPKVSPETSITTSPNYITGTIIDEESNEKMPYATIALKKSGNGTVTNINGEFGLKINQEMVDDTLAISYLGYLHREIPVKNALGNNFTIYMKREFISIPEIIIRNQIPQEIIARARDAIPNNYGKTPAQMIGFYREGVTRKSELQTYSEAILKIYKSAYSITVYNDQIKILKSRKIENSERSDTLSVRLKAGLSTCLQLDGARNIFEFMTAGSIADYKYRITDIVTYDNESAYVIEFEQRESVDMPLYKGTIYINTTDFGILKAEFEVNSTYIHKMKDSFISTGSRHFNTWPTSVKYSVSYRKVDKRYFLSHVRGDLVFSSNQKKKLFKTQFNVLFEMAITETSLNNVERFERDELAPIHSVFSKTITDYDPEFWGNMNFLRPEDNLLQALKNLNVKLQEFSK